MEAPEDQHRGTGGGGPPTSTPPHPSPSASSHAHQQHRPHSAPARPDIFMGNSRPHFLNFNPFQLRCWQWKGWNEIDSIPDLIKSIAPERAEVPGAVYASHPGSPGVALPSGGREERHVQDTVVGLCRASFVRDLSAPARSFSLRFSLFLSFLFLRAARTRVGIAESGEGVR